MPGLGKSGTSRISDFRLSIRFRSDLDLKNGIVVVRVFLLAQAAHVGKARALAQGSGQIGKLVGWPGGVYLHAPIVEIARIAGQTQRGCRALRVVAIADALHAPAHEVEACGLGVAGHGKTRIAWRATGLDARCSRSRLGLPEQLFHALGIQHPLTQIFQFGCRQRRQFLAGPTRQSAKALLNLTSQDGQFALLARLVQAFLDHWPQDFVFHKIDTNRHFPRLLLPVLDKRRNPARIINCASAVSRSGAARPAIRSTILRTAPLWSRNRARIAITLSPTASLSSRRSPSSARMSTTRYWNDTSGPCSLFSIRSCGSPTYSTIWRGNRPNSRKMPRQYSAMRSGMAASLPLCSSTWTRPPSTVSPRRSKRRFCTFGSSTSNHFATAVPVNSRIVALAEPWSSSFKATS